MAETKWALSGEFMESCNCDYLCPCIFTNARGAVTHDQCTALQVFRIDAGRFGDVDLASLKFALLIRSGKVMADGNWIFAGVVDESAAPAQRAALAAIVSGEAGGPPGFIRANLVSDFRGVAFAPIEFAMEGLARSAEIPRVLAFAIDGVPSNSEKGSPLVIDNTDHPANRRLALAKTTRMQVDAFGLRVDLAGKGNNGHFAPFAWEGAAPAGATPAREARP